MRWGKIQQGSRGGIEGEIHGRGSGEWGVGVDGAGIHEKFAGGSMGDPEGCLGMTMSRSMGKGSRDDPPGGGS